MPTPILKIPVDDAAFKRYLETFNKYQEQLRAQPEMWQDINTGMGGIALAGAAIAAEIAHQAETTRALAKEEEELARARKKEDEARRRADKEEADRSKAKADRMRHAIDQVKEYSKGVAQATLNLGKWAVIGEGASLAAGALSVWGLDRFVTGVAQDYRTSSGMGVSMGQMQGANLSMQRYFDVNSVMGNLANMQETPADWGTFRMMGINPQGKDPNQLMNEAALAARRMFLNDNQNLALAGAQGLTKVFSPEDLRRLAHADPRLLQESIRSSDKFAASSGLRDDVGVKWQNFLQTLDTAGLKLKNALVDKLTVLEPQIEVLMTQFTKFALDILSPVNLKNIGDGLGQFSKYLGSPQFQANFQTFITDIELVAKKLADALVWLGIVPAPASTPPPPGSGLPTAPSGGPSGHPQLGLLGGGGYGTGVYSMVAAQHAAEAFSKWGYTPEQVKGILSNIKSESNFKALQAERGGGKGYGIAQWGPDRQAVYAQLFGHTMQSVRDPQQALNEQLEFMQWELTSTDKRNKYKKSGDDLKKAKTAFSAGYEISQEYERPKGGRLEATARGIQATILITVKNQTGASVAATANSAAGG